MGLSDTSTSSSRKDQALHQPYADPDRPGVVRVPIVSSKHKGLEALIDAGDLELAQGKRWNWTGARGLSSRASVVAPGVGSLARLILGIIDEPDLLVQHRDGNRLDCRRENLLVRTRSEVAKARKPSPETIASLTPYPDPDRPGVWRVPLKGYRASREVLIDEADLPVVQGRHWNWGARSEDGRIEGVVVLATTGKRSPLHRLIMNISDSRTRVYFVNGDALDCRRANLAVLTMAQVVRRTKKVTKRAGTPCASAFKGVRWDTDRGQWLAQISKGRHHFHLGRFAEESDAARAYDAAARVLFGEHARPNFPEQPSGDKAIAEACRVIDEATKRAFKERLRQRQIERDLRNAANPNTSYRDHSAAPNRSEISEETARQLFDVTPAAWERWHRFGWLPPATTVDKHAAYALIDLERLLQRCGIVALPYPDPQRAGVYRVPLHGEAAQGREALIDADAVTLVQTRRWRFSPHDCGRGGEVVTVNQTEDIRLHYLVMGLSSDRTYHLGHRNDNPLDCRRENLAVRTLTDSAANKRKQETANGQACTSRFKGVCRPRKSKRWLATITKDRVQRRLGTFRDELAAAQAYDEAARQLFGEHARLNFPDGIDTHLERAAA